MKILGSLFVMSSISSGITQYGCHAKFHGVAKRRRFTVHPPHSAIVRPKHLSRAKRTIKSMRAVIQRVASASVELLKKNTEKYLHFTQSRIAYLQNVVAFLITLLKQVEGRTVSAIGSGLLVLVGLHETDADSDAEYICRKVLNMRLFSNERTGKSWDQNVMQRDYEVLLVSQFTLYGVLKGNKPDFHVAMPPDAAKLFYSSLVERFQRAYRVNAVKDGVFGAMMKVSLVNDGPVTMQLDSRQSSKNMNGEVTMPS